MSAPASSSASSTATSLLLAAQCSGVSACGPAKRALTSAPASASSATVAAPSGKWPGQSVTTCSRPRDIPPGPSSPILAVASPGCSSSSRHSRARSPSWIASTTATASGAVAPMVAKGAS